MHIPVCVHARARMRVRVCARACVCMCLCVRERRVRARVHVCVCVNVRHEEEFMTPSCCQLLKTAADSRRCHIGNNSRLSGGGSIFFKKVPPAQEWKNRTLVDHERFDV